MYRANLSNAGSAGQEASLDEQEEQAQQDMQRAHTQAQHDKMDAEQKKIRAKERAQAEMDEIMTDTTNPFGIDNLADWITTVKMELEALEQGKDSKGRGGVKSTWPCRVRNMIRDELLRKFLQEVASISCDDEAKEELHKYATKANEAW
eukprot:CAMPEP_0179480022 /NCGR_PEP_ID=MMETSP0799-20121207/58106_1 /TAXON_ID=46947 /ORGANISM="Geminigera cryophila, Strain CCMP2564" /LENGTH=148 /DNA_ID=CAMNT_0021291925 /DNA_START=161 /DNA_END=604 /DNA_ORIENTATION=-